MAPRKGKEKKEEQVISLGPQVAEGENVFGVCHIFASFNDTFVHVTDLSGKYVTQESVCFIKKQKYQQNNWSEVFISTRWSVLWKLFISYFDHVLSW